MIDLWYLNTKNISREEVSVLLRYLPLEMSDEVMRFRNHGDRCFKLFGKLMIKKYYEDANLKFNWSDWKLSFDGKPYCSGSKKFNISHSGEYVIVAFSDQEVGADIERLTDFDIMSMVSYLHPHEAEYIESASNPKDAFFRIWTRKEAYLKAIGRGIIDGLNNENCLQDKLSHEEGWRLYSLSLISDYQIALCTRVSDCQINLREVFPIEFKN